MKVIKTQSITINTEEQISTTTLSAADELILLLSSGNVFRFHIDEQKEQHLFSVNNSFQYTDGGFDINAPTTIYTLDDIVVIVNDYKRHGFVHYPEKYQALHLWREDYHADISRFPIALFKNEKGIPHLIYSAAWNHLQVMNLDSRQILTAAKSLIEENAEEDHIKFYQKYKEDNKLAWPSPYDYFFGQLAMAPGNKHFLSTGWAWGSCDAYNIYEVDHFIQNPRISDIPIGGWEHDNRAACWIDHKTVVVCYNPLVEDEENATTDSPQELHFYVMHGKETSLEKKVKVLGIDLVKSTIHFNKELNSLILFSKTEGVALVSLTGEIQFQDKNMNVDSYHPALNSFLHTNNKTIDIYQIKIE